MPRDETTVTAPSSPEQPAASAKRTKRLASMPMATPRKRPVRKQAVATEIVTDLSPDGDRWSLARRESSRQVEQFAVLALALTCGLLGFAVHFFWFPSVVLMAILVGLTAAEMRSGRRRGVISEVVAEARNVVEDITSRGESGQVVED